MTAWGGETGAACLCGVEYLNMTNISTTSEVGVVIVVAVVLFWGTETTLIVETLGYKR